MMRLLPVLVIQLNVPNWIVGTLRSLHLKIFVSQLANSDAPVYPSDRIDTSDNCIDSWNPKIKWNIIPNYPTWDNKLNWFSQSNNIVVRIEWTISFTQSWNPTWTGRNDKCSSCADSCCLCEILYIPWLVFCNSCIYELFFYHSEGVVVCHIWSFNPLTCLREWPDPLEKNSCRQRKENEHNKSNKNCWSAMRLSPILIFMALLIWSFLQNMKTISVYQHVLNWQKRVMYPQRHWGGYIFLVQ